MGREDRINIIGLQLSRKLAKMGYYSEKDKYVWIRKEEERRWILEKIDSLEILSSKQMLLAPTLETARRWVRNTLRIFPIISRTVHWTKDDEVKIIWEVDIYELKGNKSTRNKWIGCLEIDETRENIKKIAYERGIRRSIEEYNRRILDERYYTL